MDINGQWQMYFKHFVGFGYIYLNRWINIYFSFEQNCSYDMNRQVILFNIGLAIVFYGLIVRILGDVEEGMVYVTWGIYLTIVWLIDSSFSLKKEIKELKREIDELKNSLK